MPLYDHETGRPLAGQPALVRFSSRTAGGKCRCPAVIKAHSFGAPGKRCLHEELFTHPVSLRLLREMACKKVECMTTRDGSYAIMLSPQDEWKAVLVFVHAAASAGSGKDHGAIITLTSGCATCSICQDGRKQEISSKAACPHGYCIRDMIEHAVKSAGGGGATSGEEDRAMYDDLFRMQSVISTQRAASADVTSFNTSKGHYEHPSLSSKKEDANEAALGVSPLNVELGLSEISPSHCQLGGEVQMYWATAERLRLVEPIPEQTPPLHEVHGCVYHNFDGPSGWSIRETDGGGNLHPHSKAFFLSHSRDVDVWTRQCSGGHPECAIGYTGRYDGFHRNSHDTMVRHEVLLMYWHVTKSMHGPGAHSYGEMIKEIYRLAGGTREDLHYKRTLFMEAELLRSCVFGFLARQRRIMNKRCPTCPDGCRHITFDAKKLRHPVRLSSGGVSPEQITEHTPKIHCGSRKREDRLFWGGGGNKQFRDNVHSLAGAILGKASRKREIAFTDDKADAVVAGAPEGYKPAVKILLAHWKCIRSAHVSNRGDDDGDDHGGRDGASSDDGESTDSDDSHDERPAHRLQRRLEAGECPASQVGLRVGDVLLKAGECDVSTKPFGEIVRTLTELPCDIPITFNVRRRGLDNFDVAFAKLFDGGLCMEVCAAEGDRGVMITALYPKPTGLHRELAHQLFWMSHPQCEATQWLTMGSAVVLDSFLAEYDRSPNVHASTAWNLRSKGLRASIGRLIDEARVRELGNVGVSTLHPAALSFLREMLSRSKEVHAAALTIPRRVPISSDHRPVYDPSTGVAYHFTKTGERVYWWPDFKTKSDHKCPCRKPDWMRSTPNGLSEGVLTVMCLRSGIILGNTMLTGHEGCKDGASALYSYHPDLSQLESVVCDTPCMHSTYVNTRCGADFCIVKWTGDRFHIKAHTCRGIFCPDEFEVYDRSNTSLIEQWHSMMDCLSRTVKGSTLCHAMLLLQTLQDDHYLGICEKQGLPVRMWD